jgi:hypothetical protein
VTAVSGENAEAVAGKGMTQPLSRPEQRTVCASVLRQAEERVDAAKVKRLINRLRREAQTPEVATSKQVKLLADLTKLSALLFPVKPPVV